MANIIRSSPATFCLKTEKKMTEILWRNCVCNRIEDKMSISFQRFYCNLHKVFPEIAGALSLLLVPLWAARIRC